MVWSYFYTMNCNWLTRNLLSTLTIAESFYSIHIAIITYLLAIGNSITAIFLCFTEIVFRTSFRTALSSRITVISSTTLTITITRLLTIYHPVATVFLCFAGIVFRASIGAVLSSKITIISSTVQEI